MLVERRASSLDELTQVSVSTNTVSEPTPSKNLSTNQATIHGSSQNNGSVSATTSWPSTSIGQLPQRVIDPGNRGTMASTPSVYIAALAPITDSVMPRSCNASAISGALRP